MTETSLRGLATVAGLKEVDRAARIIARPRIPILKDLAKLKHLAVLDLSNSSVTEDGLQVLPQLQNLTVLDLQSTKITDTQLETLGPLAHLTQLDLSSTGITGTGLHHLRGLRNLRKLDLRDTKITDAAIQELGTLMSLTSLNLSSTQITGAGLRALRGLQSLDLSSTRLSKAGLRECGSLENLRELKLSQTDLTDDGVAELRGLKHLVTLDLSVNPITDRALHELGPLERLTSLNLSATAITDGGLKALRRLKDLTELQLDYTDIDGSGLKDLGEVDKLAKLNLDGTKLSDAGILGLRNLRKLAELRLPDRADRYEIKTNVSLLDGWRVSPDFQRLIVPLWIKPEAAAPRVFAPSYSPIALLQLDRPSEIRILPDTGVDRNALPAYLGHFTAWSANSSCLAYFGEFDSGARGWGFGNKVRWQPVCLNLKTGKTEVLQSVDFGTPPLNSRAAIHLSPSGRYVLIPTLVNPSDQRAGLRFLLWEPAAGTVRELLRAEHASGWEPYEATLAWSGDEKTIYLAVGASDGNEVETWRLCECPLDGRLPYSPQTARVLFTLTNEKGYRETRPERRIPFVIDRNLQILELRPKEDALVFYRGDTRSYWTLKLTTGRLQERFPSPFVAPRERGRAVQRGVCRKLDVA